MEAYTDPSIFQTILRNLIINGIKYTGNGGEVYIAAIENSDWVEVSVKDNGIGMDESMLADLFRLDKVRSSPGTDNETGTGLGLLLCKEFIRMYDGQIWVESAPGEGSCFTFTIRSKHKVFDI
ncbi:MAG: ATP-binding protein [Bacteroidales bacterium]|nr:ATP-binding protein [Bacteroidales bacterium]